MKRKPLRFRKTTGRFEFKFIPRLDEEPPLQFNQDRIIKSGLFLGGLFWALALVYLVIKFSALPAIVPLFYSQPWGESQLAGKEMILILPLFTLLILLINLVLAQRLFSQERLLARIIIWTATAVSILTGWTLVKIINLIT